jgi:uncharacterized delta-60 repeat protein
MSGRWIGVVTTIVFTGGSSSAALPDRWQKPTGFGSGGLVLTSFGSKASEARAIAVQADGSIVVAGRIGTAFALARYTPEGNLDTNFGDGGKVVTDVGANSRDPYKKSWEQGAGGLAIQPDGKIVAAGAGDGYFVLARYTPDGQLDQSFGKSGLVKTDFGADDYAEAVALQNDGKIVAAGWSQALFALARYTASGVLDRNFGRGGKVRSNAGADDFDIANSLAIQPDGKILAAGASLPRYPHSALARYTTAGRPDREFGGGGIAAPLYQGGWSSVALQGDDKIVASGYIGGLSVHGDNDTQQRIALVRYSTNGRFDRSFGKKGIVIGSAGFASGLAVQSDGKIVVGARDRTLYRFTPRGQLDSTFGAGGHVRTPLVANRTGTTNTIALQPDGKIVAAGKSTLGRGRPSVFTITRYAPNGQLDS